MTATDELRRESGGRMSITDELREFAPHLNLGKVALAGWKEALLAIADRIDAEHQKAIRELNNLADASVLLPVDADGERIYVGDMMERGKTRGRVIALMLSNYPKKWGGGLHWGVQLEGEQAPTALDAFFRHYHAPTVEDVLREFAEKITDSQIPGVHPTYEEAIAEYAQRLRLREVDE